MKNKNIHLIPTNKPSRLLYNSTLKSFCFQKEKDGIFINDGKVSGADFWGIEKAINNGFQSHNIYITSPNEDINENDYIITKDGRLVQVSYLLSDDLVGASKVVLTTDEDLIKDGVQMIGDDFVKWFINNPSCKEIKLEQIRRLSPLGSHYRFEGYKIIIPIAEPTSCACGANITCQCEPEEPKQESYSKEEVLKLLIHCKDKFGGTELQDYVSDEEVKEWFEQRKKQ